MKYCESHTFRQAIDHALSLRYSHTISGRPFRGTEGSSAKPTNALTKHFVQFPQKSGPETPTKARTTARQREMRFSRGPRFSARRRTVVGYRVVPRDTRMMPSTGDRTISSRPPRSLACWSSTGAMLRLQVWLTTTGLSRVNSLPKTCSRSRVTCLVTCPLLSA